MQPNNVDVQRACGEVVDIVFNKAVINIRKQMSKLGIDSLRLIGKFANVHYQGTIFFRANNAGVALEYVSLHPTLKKKGDYLLFQIKKIEEDSTRIKQLFTRLCVLKDYANIRVLLTDNLINAVEGISTDARQTLLALPTPINAVAHTESQTILYYYVKSLS